MTELTLAMALARIRKIEEAELLARHGHLVLSQQFGPDNSMVYFAKMVMGDAVSRLGRFAEAESLLLSAWDRFRDPKPITRGWHVRTLDALIRLYEAQGRDEEAARYRALRPPDPTISR